MTPTLRRKLEALAERREELERLLADPTVIADAERFRNHSREFAQLEPVAQAFSTRVARLKRRSGEACSTSEAVKSCAENPALKWPSTRSAVQTKFLRSGRNMIQASC